MNVGIDVSGVLVLKIEQTEWVVIGDIILYQ